MKTGTIVEYASTLRFCQSCEKETPHEIYVGDGCKGYVCVPCKLRGELYEENRD